MPADLAEDLKGFPSTRVGRLTTTITVDADDPTIPWTPVLTRITTNRYTQIYTITTIKINL